MARNNDSIKNLLTMLKILKGPSSKKKWNCAYYSDVLAAFSFFLFSEIISRPYNNLSQDSQAQILSQALILIFRNLFPGAWSLMNSTEFLP